MNIGIFYNRDQAEPSVADGLARSVQTAGHAAAVFSRLEEIGGVDRLIVLGGDGTILRVAKRASALGIPIFGVNFGTLGFLTEFEREECDAAVSLALDERCARIDRSMLEAELNGEKFDCLNELALLHPVAPGKENKVVTISVTIDGSHAGEFVADGRCHADGLYGVFAFGGGEYHDARLRHLSADACLRVFHAQPSHCLFRQERTVFFTAAGRVGFIRRRRLSGRSGCGGQAGGAQVCAFRHIFNAGIGRVFPPSHAEDQLRGRTCREIFVMKRFWL